MVMVDGEKEEARNKKVEEGRKIGIIISCW